MSPRRRGWMVVAGAALGLSTGPSARSDGMAEAPQGTPQSLTLSAPPARLEPGQTLQLTATMLYTGGATVDVTAGGSGTTYSTTLPAAASVDADGLVSTRGGGLVFVTAENGSLRGVVRLAVAGAADRDNDGVPDDVETTAGLNPLDGLDALLDSDHDGLTNRYELTELGTDIRSVDTDADQLTEWQETVLGTNPALFDTDGDGVGDGLEVQNGSDPRDPRRADLGSALVGLDVDPPVVDMVVNALGEPVSSRLRVLGQLRDGRTLDLTARVRGTRYRSSNLRVVRSGGLDGTLVAGRAGVAQVRVQNGDASVIVPVTVRAFAPAPAGSLALPGSLHAVAVAGDLAYVAAGPAGLHVVDVTDRADPRLLASLDTAGAAADVRVEGTLALVADGAAGLAVVDVSVPWDPRLLARLDTPGEARGVALALPFAYVADGAAGLQVVDLEDPRRPRLAGALDTPGDASGVDAAGPRVVVADGARLHVVEVGRLGTPRLLGSVAVEARAVVLDGPAAYVTSSRDALAVVDVSQPGRPRLAGTGPGGAAGALAKRGPLVFGGGAAGSLAVVDVGAAPRLRATVAVPGAGAAAGLAVDPQFLYLTSAAAAGAAAPARLSIVQYQSLEDAGTDPPVLALSAPREGQRLVENSVVTFGASARDDVLVSQVRLTVDGEPVATDDSAPYEVAFRVPAGATTLSLGATAVDLAGNVGAAPPVQVSVVPDRAPAVRIASPLDGMPVAQGRALQVVVAASDDLGIDRVELLVDDVVAGAASRAPYRFQVPVPRGGGVLSLAAEAMDTGGQVTRSAAVRVTAVPETETIVVGRVVDESEAAVAGARVRCGGARAAADVEDDGVTDAAGDFVTRGLSTAPAAITCTATVDVPGAARQTGRSRATPPVAGGITQVGEIVVHPQAPGEEPAPDGRPRPRER